MRRLLLRHQQKISSQQARLRSQIRALSAARQKVRESEAYNKVFYADSRIPLLILDPETGRCIDCNPAAARINGLPDRDAVIGKSPAELSPPRQYDGTPSDIAAAEAIKAALERGATIRAWRHRRPDGTEWDGEIHLMPFHDGRRLLVQCSIQDVTQRTESLRALQRLALYDTLTGLINRAPFIERLSETLAAAREAGKSAAILYLDLDRFKEINDAQGHTVGDEVLREVARRFAGALDAEHVLARLGGDEFAVLAADADAAGAALIAERIIGTLAWRIEVGQHAFTLGVSAGIALFPRDGEDPDTLLRHADIAMYRAKSSRRGHMHYAPEMSSGLAESITLARDLQEALRERPGELSLHYQPQFDLRGGRLLGAEALMRWTHPTLGPVPPAVFIPVAESRGMMAAIGRWVFAEGCRQIQAWRRDGRPFTGRLAINIATQQIEDARFPRADQRDHLRRRARTPAVRARTHRERDDEERRAVDRPVHPAQRLWLLAVHRRFRHRLLVALLPEAPACPQDEDRQIVRARHGRRRQRPHHRRHHHRHGSHAGHAHHRRGRGDPGAGRRAARARLRRGAGLLLRLPRTGRLLRREVAARPGGRNAALTPAAGGNQAPGRRSKQRDGPAPRSNFERAGINPHRDTFTQVQGPQLPRRAP